MHRWTAFLAAMLASLPATGSPPEPPPADVEEIEDVVVREDDPTWDPSNFPEIHRIVNVPTARTTRRNAFLFQVDHRASAPIRANPFRDFFGFDGGTLKIGLGLRFGAWNGVDVGVSRVSRGSDAFTTWELDAAWRFLRQERHHLDLAIRGGGTWFQQAPLSDSAGGGFAQLLATRSFFRDRLVISTGVLYHSSSSNETKSDADPAWSIAIPGALEGRPLTWLALGFEVIGPVAGYRSRYPAMAGSVKFVTHRHHFAILVSDTPYLSADGIVPGSDRGIRDVLIGFAISRELHL
ncbi:MAG: hypothetical protein FJ087_02740 [Deltaproteobacteria bacterium]|nr:hypothetical protein [Deltaproteobacteria bacterium]